MHLSAGAIARAGRIVLLVGLAWTSTGLAQPRAAAPSAESAGSLADVRRIFEEGDFEGAAAAIGRVQPPAERAERLEYLLLRGMVFASLEGQAAGAEERARAAFDEALRLDPEARLPPGTSPRFTSVLEVVRRRGRYGRSVVTLQLVERLPVDEPPSLQLRLLGDAGRVAAVLLWLRAPGGSFAPVETRCDADTCRAGISGSFRGTSAVEGHAIAHASIQEGFAWLGSLGSERNPFRYDLPRPRPPPPLARPAALPWWRSAWLWGGISAVALGAVVLAVVVAASAGCPADQTCLNLP